MKKYFVVLTFLINFITVFSLGDNFKELMEKATKNNFPNAHRVLVKRVEDIEYFSDGNYQKSSEEYFKILDQFGRDNSKLLYESYNSEYTNKEFVDVKIIRDGEELDFDFRSSMQIQDNPSDQESNIYDENKKLIVINIPDIKVGDIVYIKEYESSKKTRMPGNYTDYIGGQEFYPILYSSTTITGPSSNPLRTSKVYNGIQGSYTLETGRAGKKEWQKFTVFEVPQINAEPQMPNMIDIAMRWAVGTSPTWEEISKWYYKLSEPKIVVNDTVSKAAELIINGQQEDIDKIKAVFFWVSRNVRYMGINQEDNRPGLEPHNSDYTLQTMTGVCRDKAALIVSMLRSLGYNSNMVLMNASRQMEADFPNNFFNHAIASVELEGKLILMDPTDETTKTLMPEYLDGKPYLIAKKSGDTLKFNSISKPSSNELFIKSQVNYSDGKFMIKSRLIFQGINDNAYRKYLIGLKHDEREKFFKSLLKSLSANTELISFSISPENLFKDDKMEINLQYNIEDFVVGEEYKMFRVPQLSDVFGMHNWILSEFSLSERNYPLIVDSTVSVKEEVDIAIDGVEFLNLPPNVRRNSDSFDFIASYKESKDGLSFRKNLSLKKLEYSIEDYYAIRAVLGDIENYDKKYIIVKKR